jgi:transposase-like protein
MRQASFLADYFQLEVITSGGGRRHEGAGVNSTFSEARCYEMLRRVRWPDGITCPFCNQRRVTTHSKTATAPRRRYLCLTCRRTFTDLTGTPMARTNLPLAMWFCCLRLMEKGQTTSKLAKQLGVKWDTASHIQRRLITAAGPSAFIRHLRDATGRIQNE